MTTNDSQDLRLTAPPTAPFMVPNQQRDVQACYSPPGKRTTWGGGGGSSTSSNHSHDCHRRLRRRGSAPSHHVPAARDRPAHQPYPERPLRPDRAPLPPGTPPHTPDGHSNPFAANHGRSSGASRALHLRRSS